MQSLKELYKVGHGPSSSHTMGPQRAVKKFLDTYKDLDNIIVYLYGSLALTGKGHLTDYIIHKTLKDIDHEIIMDTKKECKIHPNTMEIVGYKGEEKIANWTVYSVGGGTIKVEGHDDITIPNIYNLTTYTDIKKYCMEKNITLYEYVYEVEGEDIIKYLSKVWFAMKKSIKEGLEKEGTLPGKLNIKRKAKTIYSKNIENESPEMRQTRLLSAYAYAVNEMNASGGAHIVTAPTCRSFWHFTIGTLLYAAEA